MLKKMLAVDMPDAAISNRKSIKRVKIEYAITRHVIDIDPTRLNVWPATNIEQKVGVAPAILFEASAVPNLPVNMRDKIRQRAPKQLHSALGTWR